MLLRLIVLNISEKAKEKKRVNCCKRDKLLALHAGLHLSVLQWCWHRLNSGNWRHKLKKIDSAAALQNTVAEHCFGLQSK